MTTIILCIVDFSNSSKEALQWAIGKACSLKTHLTVLYPYRLTRPQNGESVITVKKKIEEEAAKKFAVLEKDLLLNNEISYDFKIEVGFVIDRVKEYAKNSKIKLIVMDKNMITNNKESFDEILSYIDEPLLIVPE